MYKFLLSIALFLSVATIHAQDLRISFQTGYGFYDMSSFTNITKEVYKNLPFESKIISNYPPYNYYQPMIILTNDRFDIGVLYLFQTTGSKISSKDYSGEYLFDSKINCHSPGIILGYKIKEYNKINIGLSVQAGLNFNTLKYIESLQVDNQVINDDKSIFTANNFYFKPDLNFSYTWKRLSGNLNIGYLKEIFRDNYTLEGASENYIPVNEKFTESDVWDGFRIGITFSYIILKNKKNI